MGETAAYLLDLPD